MKTRNKLSAAIVLAVTSLSVQYAAADLVGCDACIEASDIADRAITASKMSRNAISAQNIRNSAVTTAKIADGAVTADKLASGAVDASKLAGYDYRDFGGGSAGVSQRVYSIVDSNGVCDTEIHDITRAVQGDGSTLVTNTRTRFASAGGPTCTIQAFTSIADDTGHYLQKRDNYDETGTVLLNSSILANPVPQRTTNMAVGIDYGSASVVDDTVTGNVSFFSQRSVLLGLEDVTVPAGTFSGCMKVYESRDSGVIGNFDRVSWYCAGVGLVKRIAGTNNRFNNNELVSYTTSP